jgi:hypothetical protein
MFGTQFRTFRRVKAEPKYGQTKPQPEAMDPNPISHTTYGNRGF